VLAFFPFHSSSHPIHRNAGIDNFLFGAVDIGQMGLEEIIEQRV
jgi:hypothetical protein